MRIDNRYSTRLNLCMNKNWRGAGAVERGGLENRCSFLGTQGSNPCLSAVIIKLTAFIKTTTDTKYRLFSLNCARIVSVFTFCRKRGKVCSARPATILSYIGSTEKVS